MTKVAPKAQGNTQLRREKQKKISRPKMGADRPPFLAALLPFRGQGNLNTPAIKPQV